MIIKLVSQSGAETVVKIVEERPKAIKVCGNCGSAWFPKSAISDEGLIAPWFNFSISHQFLFHAPYTGA